MAPPCSRAPSCVFKGIPLLGLLFIADVGLVGEGPVLFFKGPLLLFLFQLGLFKPTTVSFLLLTWPTTKDASGEALPSLLTP